MRTDGFAFGALPLCLELTQQFRTATRSVEQVAARKLAFLGRVAAAVATVVKREQPSVSAVVKVEASLPSSSSAAASAEPKPEPALEGQEAQDPILDDARDLVRGRLLAVIKNQKMALKLARQQVAYWRKRAETFKTKSEATEKRRLEQTSYVQLSKRRKKDSVQFRTSVRGGVGLAVRRNFGSSGGRVLTQTLEA